MVAEKSGFSILPNSEWYDELDPFIYGLLFQGWQYRQEKEYDLLKSIGILIGSFTNPQAAKDMLRSENAEFQSSDEDFEKTTQMIEDDVKRQNNTKHRRRRKLAVKANLPE